MNIGLLIVSILLLLIFCIGFVFLYSYYFNAKNKIYHKIKFNYSTWGMFGLLIFIFLLIAILLTVSFCLDVSSLAYKNIYVIPISWILLTFSIVLLVLVIVIKIKINSTRLEITNFRDENFQDLLNKVSLQIDEKELENKHPRYFSILKQKQEIINTMMNSFSIEKYQNILTEIIMFDETMTTKWNKKLNMVQLKIFYEMCLKLQQIINK